MKKQLVIIGIFLLLVVSVSGCNENSNKTNNINKFIGTWEGISYSNDVNVNITFTFFKDKTAKQVSDELHTHLFYYEIDDNSLYLTLQEFPEIDPIIYSYEFSDNDNALTLTNESFDTIILTKS
jgi:hypothetical protein